MLMGCDIPRGSTWVLEYKHVVTARLNQWLLLDTYPHEIPCQRALRTHVETDIAHEYRCRRLIP
jgi:hypothetical protein